jgi:hypothetical protein
MRLHVYICFKCGSSGNHLDLYAAATGRGPFEAAIELCERLNREIPWVLEERGVAMEHRTGVRAPEPPGGRWGIP